jgi:hypothetical protein
MLIDDFLPAFQVVEHHQRLVSASRGRTYAAIWDADFAASLLVKGLLILRAIPTLVSDPAGTHVPSVGVTLREILRQGFELLAEEPGREVLLGVSGRFWKLRENLSRAEPQRFREPVPEGLARAAWNFTVSERGEDTTLLSTETRVLCSGDAALRSFRRYWFVVGPFSGLIRRHMLRSIARVAEDHPPACGGPGGST